MARTKTRAPEPTNLKGFARYWRVSQHPLQCLIFLSPFIFFYELGTILWAHNPETGVTLFNIGRSILKQFFEWFGLTGYYLPGLIVVAVLLAWHVVKRDPWKLEPKVYPLMLGESVALALPLFVFLTVIGRLIAPMASTEGTADAPTHLQLVFIAGAGIYEEMLFRLIGIALLHMIFVDILGLPDRIGSGITIALTSIAFALCHFISTESYAAFTWVKMLQLTLAGVYFALVYITRGFGVVAGTHTCYDLTVLFYKLILR